VPRGLGSVPPLIRGVLRLGVYQMDQLDRVPPHAAVSTSVDLAREVAGAKAAGFVNAVLRRAGEAGNSGSSREPSPALSVSSALSTRFSHQEWLVARWVERFGAEDTEALLAWNNQRPVLVVQPGRESEPQIGNRFKENRIEFEAAPFGAGLIVTGRSPPTCRDMPKAPSSFRMRPRLWSYGSRTSPPTPWCTTLVPPREARRSPWAAASVR
jgi:hypothetical protein